MRVRLVLLLSSLLVSCATLPEQAAARVASPSLEVWPDVPPGSENWKQTELQHELGLAPVSNVVVRNVTRPTITPYLPDPERATGAALGFSAGGMLSSRAMLATDPAVRFNFVATIYGVAVPDEAKIGPDLPPVFLAVSANDSLMAEPTQHLARRLLASGVSTELHVFRRGGHAQSRPCSAVFTQPRSLAVARDGIEMRFRI